MSEEKLLKYYGCNSLSEFIDTYLDCETAFDLLRSQFKEIKRLNNIINKAINYTTKQMKKYEGYDKDFEIVLSNIVVMLGSDKE